MPLMLNDPMALDNFESSYETSFKTVGKHRYTIRENLLLTYKIVRFKQKKMENLGFSIDKVN